MKYLEVTITPSPAVTPSLFSLLADSPHVEEALVRQVMVTEGTFPTVLLEIVGDHGRVVPDLVADPIVVQGEAMAVSDDRCYAFLRLDPPPPIRPIFDIVNRRGIVILPPSRFFDGGLRHRLLGRPGDLQALMEAIPDVVACEVDEIGSFRVPASVTSGLTDRQREALEVARELGYYEDPRGATHADVAARLGCSPSTAGEHLRKAESTLVAATLDG